MEKLCRICKTIKPLDDFNKKTRSKDGYQRICKDCSSSVARSGYIHNKEGRLNQVKKWQKIHRPQMLANMQEYSRKPINRLFRSLKGHPQCSREELRAFLEKSFSGDISWDNYGIKWKIGYKLPKEKFANLDEYYHYTNIKMVYS